MVSRRIYINAAIWYFHAKARRLMRKSAQKGRSPIVISILAAFMALHWHAFHFAENIDPRTISLYCHHLALAASWLLLKSTLAAHNESIYNASSRRFDNMPRAMPDYIYRKYRSIVTTRDGTERRYSPATNEEALASHACENKSKSLWPSNWLIKLVYLWFLSSIALMR